MLKIKNKIVKELVEKYREIHILSEVSSILHWDQNVSMPRAGAEGRAAQLTYLQNQITDMWHNGDFDKKLKSLDTKSLTVIEKAIVRNLERAIRYYTRVPKPLIAEKTEVNVKAFSVWQEARQQNNYRMYQNILKKVFDIERQVAGYLADTRDPYDALLDLYEPELTSATVKKLFGEIKPEIRSLLHAILKSKTYRETNPFMEQEMRYAIDMQKKLSDFMLKKMHYPPTHGRLDVSAHPFTTALGAHDIRITTRYYENDFRSSYSSTVHEAGHALYELGVNHDYAGTPLAGGVSLGIHESQSRFWENLVGKNPLFLGYLEPILLTLFPAEFTGTTRDDLVRYVNHVRPGYIRVEADEVTYNLHIILRFEVEHDLINNKLKFEDLRDAWNTKMKQYFGIAPTKDSDGVLQDVHWSYGSIGYFPTYTLGNIYSAQFAARMRKDLKFEELLRHGDLSPIREWLRKHIHVYGSELMPNDLVKNVCGETINTKYYLDYLNTKYSRIYF